jgi:integrase
MNLYQKNGVWYAPPWKNTVTGQMLGAHSLGTRDADEAETRWVLERAAHLSSCEKPATVAKTMRLGEALSAYLDWKKGTIADATLENYRKVASRMVRALGDVELAELEGHAGTLRIKAWADSEIARLGRTTSVFIAQGALLAPALRFAVEAGALGRLPVFAKFANDYYEKGRREYALTVDEFIRWRAEMPARAVFGTRDGKPGRIGRSREGLRSIVVFPQLWADLAVSTGMHPSDIARLQISHVRLEAGEWWRDNRKNARHYRPCWLPLDPYLAEMLARHLKRREQTGGADLWVAEDAVPARWQHRFVREAATAARLPPLAAIDLRHTFAVWCVERGWAKEETARWLANSGGIVERVYGHLPVRRLRKLVSEGAEHHARLLEAADARRGPRVTRQVGPSGDAKELPAQAPVLQLVSA